MISGPHLDPERLRAIAAGADVSDSEAEHLLDCDRCASATLDADGESCTALDTEIRQGFDAIAKQPSSWNAASEERVLSALLLTQAQQARRRSAQRTGAVVALLAAAAGVLLVLKGGTVPSVVPGAPIDLEHATAYPESGASLTVEQHGADEQIALAGTATFAVRKLSEGHRFRVLMQGDEIEVRGTKFTAVADAHGVRSVNVEEGRVEVRTRCCGLHVLSAGDSFNAEIARRTPGDSPTQLGSRTEPAAPSAVAKTSDSAGDAVANTDEPASSASAQNDPLPSSTSTGAATDAPTARSLMTQGTQAFDEGRWSAASSMLDRAVSLDPSAAWAKDARVLAGAARVMAAPVGAVASMGVGVASLDVAAQQAARRGDSRRAAAAKLGAARKLSGEAAKKRWCALANDGSLDSAGRSEARSRCP
ncbi:MAG: FecR domain-containing protein [Polyangiaceae bacterium]